MSNKYTINLLQPELLPDKALLTLGRVVSLWSVVFVVMLAMAISSRFYLDQANSKYQVALKENKQLKKKLSNLEQQFKSNRVDSALAERLELLKLTMVNKHALHTQLTDPKNTYVMGFSTAMSELSSYHHNEISLQQVKISNQSLTFKGFARRPEAVPAWLEGFESSQLLSGKSFVHFKLEENEDKVTTFIVSSEKQEGAE